MSKPEDHGEVTYLSEVIKRIETRIRAAGTAAQKVLPGQRGKLILPLEEALALLRSTEEVLDRSGMGKRLGFIKVENGIKPVILESEGDDADEVSEGAVLSVDGEGGSGEGADSGRSAG